MCTKANVRIGLGCGRYSDRISQRATHQLAWENLHNDKVPSGYGLGEGVDFPHNYFKAQVYAFRKQE